MLDYVEVQNTIQCRIFRRMHYTVYIKTVIKNNTITAIINEAKRWQERQEGTAQKSTPLKEHLDKIQQIETDSHPISIPDTYEGFDRRAALDYDLNEYTRTEFMQKQQLERQ